MTTLEEVLNYINNFFIVDERHGRFVIEDHSMAMDFLQEGQYYKISGSVFNDGVHKYGDPDDKLDDETFYGVIYPMAVPKAILTTCVEIDAWLAKYGDAQLSPYTSESFGGYSYSKSQGYGRSSANSTQITWRTIFGSKLNAWRKI